MLGMALGSDAPTSSYDRSRLTAAILLIVFVALTKSAPATIGEIEPKKTDIAEYFSNLNGCFYNYQHYDEGDRIVTSEPCLNCTCHNRMLMCFLRVCPFTKAIGQDCIVEKSPDQCCPTITCPEVGFYDVTVPVELLTSSTTQIPTTTTVGWRDNYGCIMNDNEFFADGAQLPIDLTKPCELCYCIRNRTACVMQECTLHVEGCRPVYLDGVCCPVRYDCDYEKDKPTTSAPQITGGLVFSTTSAPFGCRVNDEVYNDGESIPMLSEKPCHHCYCMRGDIVCAVQDCGEPLRGKDCVPEPTPAGQCCPTSYRCANDTINSDDVTTLTPVMSTFSDENEAEKNPSLEEAYQKLGENKPALPSVLEDESIGVENTENPIIKNELSTIKYEVSSSSTSIGTNNPENQLGFDISTQINEQNKLNVMNPDKTEKIDVNENVENEGAWTTTNPPINEYTNSYTTNQSSVHKVQNSTIDKDNKTGSFIEPISYDKHVTNYPTYTTLENSATEIAAIENTSDNTTAVVNKNKPPAINNQENTESTLSLNTMTTESPNEVDQSTIKENKQENSQNSQDNKYNNTNDQQNTNDNIPTTELLHSTSEKPISSQINQENVQMHHGGDNYSPTEIPTSSSQISSSSGPQEENNVPIEVSTTTPQVSNNQDNNQEQHNENTLPAEFSPSTEESYISQINSQNEEGLTPTEILLDGEHEPIHQNPEENIQKDEVNTENSIVDNKPNNIISDYKPANENLAHSSTQSDSNAELTVNEYENAVTQSTVLQDNKKVPNEQPIEDHNIFMVSPSSPPLFAHDQIKEIESHTLIISNANNEQHSTTENIQNDIIQTSPPSSEHESNGNPSDDHKENFDETKPIVNDIEESITTTLSDSSTTNAVEYNKLVEENLSGNTDQINTDIETSTIKLNTYDGTNITTDTQKKPLEGSSEISLSNNVTKQPITTNDHEYSPNNLEVIPNSTPIYQQQIEDNNIPSQPNTQNLNEPIKIHNDLEISTETDSINDYSSTPNKNEYVSKNPEIENYETTQHETYIETTSAVLPQTNPNVVSFSEKNDNNIITESALNLAPDVTTISPEKNQDKINGNDVSNTNNEIENENIFNSSNPQTISSNVNIGSGNLESTNQFIDNIETTINPTSSSLNNNENSINNSSIGISNITPDNLNNNEILTTNVMENISTDAPYNHESIDTSTNSIFTQDYQGSHISSTEINSNAELPNANEVLNSNPETFTSPIEIEGNSNESSVTQVPSTSDEISGDGVDNQSNYSPTKTEEETISTTDKYPGEKFDESSTQINSNQRVPGEGSCLVDFVTYPHKAEVPKSNPCHEKCECLNSIVTCTSIECPPPPHHHKNCIPLHPGNESWCCPTYMCDGGIEQGLIFESHNQIRPQDFPTEISKDKLTQENDANSNANDQEYSTTQIYEAFEQGTSLPPQDDTTSNNNLNDNSQIFEVPSQTVSNKLSDNPYEPEHNTFVELTTVYLKPTENKNPDAIQQFEELTTLSYENNKPTTIENIAISSDSIENQSLTITPIYQSTETQPVSNIENENVESILTKVESSGKENQTIPEITNLNESEMFTTFKPYDSAIYQNNNNVPENEEINVKINLTENSNSTSNQIYNEIVDIKPTQLPIEAIPNDIAPTRIDEIISSVNLVKDVVKNSMETSSKPTEITYLSTDIIQENNYETTVTPEESTKPSSSNEPNKYISSQTTLGNLETEISTLSETLHYTESPNKASNSELGASTYTPTEISNKQDTSINNINITSYEHEIITNAPSILSDEQEISTNTPQIISDKEKYSTSFPIETINEQTISTNTPLILTNEQENVSNLPPLPANELNIDTNPTQPDISSSEQPASTNQPEISSSEPPASSNQPEISSYEQSASTDQPEISSSEQQASTNQPEIFSSEQPSSSKQPEIPSSEQPASTNQPEISSSEPPASSNQPEISSYEQSASTNQPEISSSEQQASTNQPEIPLSEQQASTNQPEIPLSEQQAFTNQPEISSSEPLASSNQPEISSYEQSASTNQPEISSSEQQASTNQPEIPLSEQQASTNQPEIPLSEQQAFTNQPEISSSEPLASSNQPEISSYEQSASTNQPEISSSEQQASTNQPEIPLSEQQASTNQPEIPLSEQQAFTNQPEISSSEPLASSNQPEISSYEQSASTNQPEISSSEQQASTNQPEIPLSEQQAFTNQPEISSSEPPVSSIQPEISSYVQLDSTNQPDIPSSEQQTFTNRPEVSSSEQPASTTQPEVSSYETLASTDQPEISSYEQPDSTNQPEISSSEQQTFTNRPEVSSSEQPASSNQPEIPSSEQQASTNQPEISSYETSASTDQPEISSSEQPASTNHPELSSHEQSASTDQPEISSYEQPASINPPQVLSNEQENSNAVISDVNNNEPDTLAEQTPEITTQYLHSSDTLETVSGKPVNFESANSPSQPINTNVHEAESHKLPEITTEYVHSQVQQNVSSSTPFIKPAEEYNPITEISVSEIVTNQPIVELTEKLPVSEYSTNTNTESTEKVDTKFSSLPSNQSSNHEQNKIPQDSGNKVQIPFDTEIPETYKPSDTPTYTHKPSFSSIPQSSWTQKPFHPESTSEAAQPDQGFSDEYEDENEAVFGPGTCRYGGKIYVSAQQVPRDDPCDFCFCFRGDIICLQQSCPPPIFGCYQDTIQGFCCPRYECPVAQATQVNVTTTTTTTTTTVPPHFFANAYRGAARRSGCLIHGHAYRVGEDVGIASGPCMQCICGDDGKMQCNPKACSPEPVLRKMLAETVNSRR
ncbi:probable serine/threonine-protein kinase DDB_G0282963 isoform X10 [Daktulosphaira vitifoliae]|uniref:probable serine/threonine-protein kinase DDB_G0282963 isoform X10 n=1 Tax=Daktulosphaira vitifoliae TaxID=58002 RepID=UPI0021AA058F|nr:probable serine/threonine-protein kinase DDB_G0282963 isoform X10 [Daktulosphaira vitifoliae]